MDPALHKALYPEHSYSDETYWADLRGRERLTWINKESNNEARRELGQIWRSFKADPLAPFVAYWNRYGITGLGLFIEGYLLFSIGNLSSLYSAAWPSCWSKYTSCSKTWVQSVDYLEIVGIIIGQIGVGIIGDWVGRRYGLIQDAAVMLLGSAMLTASWGLSLQGWVVMYTFSLFIFGVGVGGEYPMTSTRALESFRSTTDRLHRGRNVVLAFLMQGWGQLVNQGILIVCLLIFNSGGNPPYTPAAVQPTFRVQFGFIVLVTLWLVYYRVYKIKGADRILNRSKGRNTVTGYDKESLKLTVRYFWHRLIGTAGGWFCNDFFFYGNKIFQGAFLAVISPNSSTVMDKWLWNLVNIGCELAGYYMAAITIDWKLWGRKRMQATGFLADFVLFMIATALFNPLQTPGAAIKVFQFIYFFSSFWNQFGPNCTTFLLAAEVYPAEVRGTAHGVSAAVGKLGALAPAILYNYIDNHTKFWVVTWLGLLGFAFTVIFIPDTTGLDLKELERFWTYVRAGRGSDYHGPAVHSRHLSWWEVTVLQMHKQYNPELDAEARLQELKEQAQQQKAMVVGKDVDAPDNGYDSDIDSAIVDNLKHETAEEGAM